MSSAISPSNCSIFIEPQQGAIYDDQLCVALQAESLGFGAFFRSDHFLKMGDVSGEPGPTESWITLAGLARDTTSIRLGTLVSSATFRFPGVLAIGVAQVDQMSGGRVELGLGAGWYAEEHSAYAIPFPELSERFDRLEEQLAVITGLWGTPVGETFSFNGRYFPIVDSPALPKPTQSSLPVVIGGRGSRRTPALAARYAAEFNTPFVEPNVFVEQRIRVRNACDAIGRHPDSINFSAALVACVGTDDAEFERRAAAIGREPDELRAHGVCGTLSQARATIERWTELGASRFHLQVLDLADLDHLDLLADLLT